jgi:putative transposase
MEVDKDHIHLMVTSVPKISPLQIVRNLKQETTVRIWKRHPELKKQFWKEKTFWREWLFLLLYWKCFYRNSEKDY